MENKTSINQQTVLRTRLTPQQVRFVRLLEMSAPELNDAIHNELEENPALEALPDTPSADTEHASDDEGATFAETADQLQVADYSSEDDIPPYLLTPGRNRGNDNDMTDFVVDQHHETPSMVESLENQLDMVDAPARDIALARYLVGYLDDNGRLSRSIGEIADDIAIATGLDITKADLKPALDIIRYQLEPPGLGAVDLRECLLIQLKRRQPKTVAVRAAEEIVESYFDLFVKKHFDRLRTALGVDKALVDEACETIRSLNPKPGRELSDTLSEKTAHITPDFYVTEVDGLPDRFSVTLAGRHPELAVEQSFLVEPKDSAARLFVRRRRNDANTFVGLIRRRDQTLLQVMQAIVSFQRKFFETEQPADLRPMILNDITELTGLDKSIISRATSGKYVATDGGIYPLKMFFNDSPTDDTETSSVEIMTVLNEIIAGEDKRKPLSDRALTDMLNERGYALARRTVTKYREKNNIPVARLRKQS